MSSVRLLTPADAGLLRVARLDALRRAPDAYLTSLEEGEAHDVAWFADRLSEGAADRGVGVVGAFEGVALVGFVGFRRAERQRARHKAFIWGLWVAPEARRRGLGRALMEAALAELRAAGDIERVLLSVSLTQTPACALYQGLGFTPYGLEHRAMKLDDRYIDEQLLELSL